MKTLLIILCLITLSYQYEGFLNYSSQDDWPGICAEKKKNQSPVNITIKDCPIIDNVKIKSVKYKKIDGVSLTFEHGYKFMVDASKNGYIIVDIKGKKFKYILQDVHFHLNSEHTIDGNLYKMETHLVHKLDSSKTYKSSPEKKEYLVIGLIFNVTDKNEENEFVKAFNFKDQKKIKKFNLTPYVKDKSFYYYQGGLTTPNCDEEVNWIVMKDIYYMSNDQFNDFSNYFKEKNYNRNNRKIWDLEGRVVSIVENGAEGFWSNFFVRIVILIMIFGLLF